MTINDWNREIQLAKAASIDGFAVNAGPSDSYGPEQISNAYKSAEANNFKLFISFDMVSPELSSLSCKCKKEKRKKERREKRNLGSLNVC